MNRQPIALVTDGERGSSLAIVRSLGRRGWRVVACAREGLAPALASKYAAAAERYPDPERGVKAYVQRIAELAERERVDLILPVTDNTLLPLVKHRAALPAHCTLGGATPEQLDLVCDKQRTLELARKLDVPVPRTWVVHGPEDLDAALAELGFPVVVKPARSRIFDSGGSALKAFNVQYAFDRAQAAAIVARVAGAVPLLFQERCAGQGIGVELCTRAGEVVLAFQHRRLAELPITGGASAWRASMELDPVLYGHAQRLARALGWTGLMMVEFKVGPKALLMEINGRVWGSLPLACRAGVDFPAAWADVLLGRSPTGSSTDFGPIGAYPSGVRCHQPGSLLIWIANVALGRRRYPQLPVPRRRRALAALAALFGFRSHSDIFAWDDLQPAWVDLRQTFSKIGVKLQRSEHS
jgi:predicted ATP-grasp superfamily ATP-dependent carboligase